MAYLVWHTHEEINVLNRYSSDTAQGKALQQTLDADQRFNSNVSELAKEFEIEKMITSKMTMLGYPQFIDAEQEYQKVKKNRNHIFWYQLYNGPASIKKLAEYLGESALYETHYGGHSGSIHGTKVMHGLCNKPA
ncbi:hypothetical protein BWI97_25370 [Siphonobacter sp. BAB-5405]|nr:hypothetical protein BWI97_25370 [Siphonobacter sp. BAB-5405]